MRRIVFLLPRIAGFSVRYECAPSAPEAAGARRRSPSSGIWSFMTSIVLTSSNGSRVELFVDDQRTDLVKLPRFERPLRVRTPYDEQALRTIAREHLAMGFERKDVEPVLHAALDVDAEVLTAGLAPLVVRRLCPLGRREASSWLDDLELHSLVAIPGNAPEAQAPHVAALHRFVVGTRRRQLLLDADLDNMYGHSPPAHRGWLVAWLDALRGPSGALRALGFRHCRLFDLRPEALAGLEAFRELAFVGAFPKDFSFAARAEALMLGCALPSDELPEKTIRALAQSELPTLRKLSLEVSRDGQTWNRGLDWLFRWPRMPELRELEIVGAWPSNVLNALLDSPLARTLERLRLDAWIQRNDLATIEIALQGLRHIARVEINLLTIASDAIVTDLAPLAKVVPNLVALPSSSRPVCPF